MELKIENILKQSGWELGRRVEISDIKKMYDENGYKWNNLQIDFVSEYAYLELTYQHPVWKQDVTLNMNPIIAQKSIDMDVVEEYEAYFGQMFLVVGEIERENMTIFIDASGELYGAYDDCVIKWGNDFCRMLSNLIDGVKGELVIVE